MQSSRQRQLIAQLTQQYNATTIMHDFYAFEEGLTVEVECGEVLFEFEALANVT